MKMACYLYKKLADCIIENDDIILLNNYSEINSLKTSYLTGLNRFTLKKLSQDLNKTKQNKRGLSQREKYRAR